MSARPSVRGIWLGRLEPARAAAIAQRPQLGGQRRQRGGQLRLPPRHRAPVDTQRARRVADELAAARVVAEEERRAAQAQLEKEGWIFPSQSNKTDEKFDVFS